MNPKPEQPITPGVNEGEFSDEKATQKIESTLKRLEQGMDLEASAQYCGALRRKRVVKSARDLLRFVVAYSLMDWPLWMVGAWGTAMQVGSLSKNGLRKRLRQCQAWIGMLIMNLLMNNQVCLSQHPGMRVRLFDATCVSYPGSKKADWRLHLSFDLSHLRINDMQLMPSPTRSVPSVCGD